MKIFAYGSNMCTARLQARVPSARPLQMARLPDHSLRFHKRGWRDGSGKGDAFASAGGHVWGVLFQIDDLEKPHLDAIEGLGRGYDQTRLPAISPDGDTHQAWLYRASASSIDPDAVPFRWYRDLVLAGAREHGLPDDYVHRHILSCSTCVDSDADRARHHRALLTVRPAAAPIPCSASPRRSR